MNRKIKCPKCQEEFEITQDHYESIVSQVSKTFKQEIIDEEAQNHRRAIELLKQENQNNIAATKQEIKSEYQNIINDLQLQLKTTRENLRLEQEKLLNAQEKEFNGQILEKQTKIQNLESKLKNYDDSKKLEIDSQINIQIQKYNELKSEFNAIKEKSKQEKEDLEKELARLREHKLSLSIKLIGEDLEQHCLNTYNQYLRPNLKNAIFAKDNDVLEGTKGDFVFRETTDDGIEFVSIMFEMKNESENSTNKKKNEDFFRKLSNDRDKKRCEYAVLVSMLEPENDTYNSGIYDASTKDMPNLYVIRPNNFIALINLLRNIGLKSIDDKREIIENKRANLDFANFSENLAAAKEGFSKNVELANKHFDNVIDKIDKSIKDLEATREGLLKTKKQLSTANNKVDDITVRKLTKNAPSIAELIKQADKK
ncbi:DUF2130 domain-containing protein [Mycoplasma enhydrae]|uniref:DUF2130 domain-containing protein n=1 Tax=Mycoplasma enhydrae TaxID=2499220 RepID=UPI00197C31E9|nr:DUF2130 domain-containing protein [Mycoplasma enhydrae]MBN4089345.1 DUF2130 domain-containing protein [Mycoplasma enhydrae]MCV3733717.1 DUF2130 domain-containing protein [Mycoplasma enhydrae]